jgi:hypothetical protein
MNPQGNLLFKGEIIQLVAEWNQRVKDRTGFQGSLSSLPGEGQNGMPGSRHTAGRQGEGRIGF